MPGFSRKGLCKGVLLMTQSIQHRGLLLYGLEWSATAAILAKWKFADIPYVVDAVAPFGDRDQLMVEFGKGLTNHAAGSASGGAS